MNINITKIEEQISELKKNMNCPNQSYRIGYLCALSAVQGIIAEAKHYEKCAHCKYLNPQRTIFGYRCDRPNHFWRYESSRYKHKHTRACRAFQPKETNK